MTRIWQFDKTDPQTGANAPPDVTRLSGFGGQAESLPQAEVAAMVEKMGVLVDQMAKLRMEVLERPIKWTAQIHDLNDADYELSVPMLVLIEEYPNDEVVIARFPEVEAFAEGVTASEAIANLKRLILDLYDELSEAAVDSLGDLPQAWLRVLRQTVSKVRSE